MEKAIYKFTNKENGMVYIGAASRPKKRYKEHFYYNTDVYFSNIAHQFGEDKFDFEIIGWYEDWEEKEKYYIDYYNALFPNGYNIDSGGGKPPILRGESNHFCKISNRIADEIKKDLLDYSIRRRDIIKKYGISTDLLRHINDGSAWKDDQLLYPLRPFESEIDLEIVERIKWLLANTNMTHQQIADSVGWAKSAVTMINIGKNHYDASIHYPIRHIKPKIVFIEMYEPETNTLIKKFKTYTEATAYVGVDKSCRYKISSVVNDPEKTAFGYKWKVIYDK